MSSQRLSDRLAAPPLLDSRNVVTSVAECYICFENVGWILVNLWGGRPSMRRWIPTSCDIHTPLPVNCRVSCWSCLAVACCLSAHAQWCVANFSRCHLCTHTLFEVTQHAPVAPNSSNTCLCMATALQLRHTIHTVASFAATMWAGPASWQLHIWPVVTHHMMCCTAGVVWSDSCVLQHPLQYCCDTPVGASYSLPAQAGVCADS
jgi:hypothetical protein